MDMELVVEGFTWCCEWILLLKIILDIIIKQNGNFAHKCRKKLFDTFIRDFKAYYD